MAYVVGIQIFNTQTRVSHFCGLTILFQDSGPYVMATKHFGSQLLPGILSRHEEVQWKTVFFSMGISQSPEKKFNENMTTKVSVLWGTYFNVRPSLTPCPGCLVIYNEG